MSVDEYDPSTALTAYFQDRNTRRAARLWSVEKLLHDLAEVGFVTFFEGAGDNPTQIAGYAIGKLWLRTSPLVTTEPGEFRAYAGSGDATLLSSWPILNADGVRRHLSIYSKAEVDAIFAAGLPASFSSNVVTNASGVTGATVTAALNTLSISLSSSVSSLTASLATEESARTAADAVLTSGVANATFPAGTRLLFQQTAAPTGWTKDTTHNNKALRVVSGTASSGGASPFTTVFANRTIARANLPNVTLTGTTSTDGDHTHAISPADNLQRINGNVGGGTSGTVTNGIFTVSNTIGNAGAHSHTFTTSSLNGGVTQTGLDFDVQYVDAVICVKN